MDVTPHKFLRHVPYNLLLNSNFTSTLLPIRCAFEYPMVVRPRDYNNATSVHHTVLPTRYHNIRKQPPLVCQYLLWALHPHPWSWRANDRSHIRTRYHPQWFSYMPRHNPFFNDPVTYCTSTLRFVNEGIICEPSLNYLHIWSERSWSRTNKCHQRAREGFGVLHEDKSL